MYRQGRLCWSSLLDHRCDEIDVLLIHRADVTQVFAGAQVPRVHVLRPVDAAEDERAPVLNLGSSSAQKHRRGRLSQIICARRLRLGRRNRSPAPEAAGRRHGGPSVGIGRCLGRTVGGAAANRVRESCGEVKADECFGRHGRTLRAAARKGEGGLTVAEGRTRGYAGRTREPAGFRRRGRSAPLGVL